MTSRRWWWLAGSILLAAVACTSEATSLDPSAPTESSAASLAVTSGEDLVEAVDDEIIAERWCYPDVYSLFASADRFHRFEGLPAQDGGFPPTSLALAEGEVVYTWGEYAAASEGQHPESSVRSNFVFAMAGQTPATGSDFVRVGLVAEPDVALIGIWRDRAVSGLLFTDERVTHIFDSVCRDNGYIEQVRAVRDHLGLETDYQTVEAIFADLAEHFEDEVSPWPSPILDVVTAARNS